MSRSIKKGPFVASSLVKKIDALNAANENKIVKRKKVEVKPMNEEEAILQMELLGHQFYMYKDSESNKAAVVYKRNDGNYGVIESE